MPVDPVLVATFLLPRRFLEGVPFRDHLVVGRRVARLMREVCVLLRTLPPQMQGDRVLDVPHPVRRPVVRRHPVALGQPGLEPVPP